MAACPNCNKEAGTSAFCPHCGNAVSPEGRPRTRTNPDLWAPGSTSDSIPVEARQPPSDTQLKRARWYELAGEARPADADGLPITGGSATEVDAPGAYGVGAFLNADMRGWTKWVTGTILVVGPLAFLFAFQVGPRLTTSLSVGGLLGFVACWFAAWQVLGKKDGAGVITAASLGYCVIYAGAMAAGGMAAYGVLLVVLVISAALGFVRPWMPLQAGAGALGIASMVAMITVASGLSAREAAVHEDQIEATVPDDNACDEDMGVCVKVPLGVRIVPGAPPGWVVDALGEDPSAHLIVLASDDGSLFGYVRAERAPRKDKLNVYMEQHMRYLGDSRRADELLPPMLRSSSDFEAAAFEFTAPDGSERGIATFVGTKDERVITLLAYGPAVTYALLMPKLIRLAAALRISAPPKTPLQ